MSNELTKVEAGTLQAYEKAIERGLASFVEVGRALTQIRDSRLYRATHATFEDYCEQRWNMTSRRASQVIEASGVADRVAADSKKNSSDLPPILRASHAEALADLPADEQAEAYAEAVETAPDGKLTAEHVEAVVEARKPSKPAAAVVVNSGPAPIWKQAGDFIDRALTIYRDHGQDGDDTDRVIQLLTDAEEAHRYYVREVETP